MAGLYNLDKELTSDIDLGCRDRGRENNTGKNDAESIVYDSVTHIDDTKL